MKFIHQKNVSQMISKNTGKLLNSTSVYAISVAGILALAILTAGCKTTGHPDSTSSENFISQVSVSRGPDEISVMTYNVENMFDTVHNDGVDDYTYLPFFKKNTPEVQESCKKISNPFYRGECFNKDWNDDVLNFKLSQVAKVITYMDNGKGPDNIIFAEVENENVLNQLVKNHLAALGYQTVSILKGPDTRGINTAFISKFPLVGKPILHIIPYTDSHPEELKQAQKSRGILETTVKIHNKDVTFLAAHFPSQSNPTEWRRQAMEHMKKLMVAIEKKGQAVIAGGDLNTTEKEESDHGYFSKILSQGGDVSHLVGCASCKGTHSYKGGWSFLDILVFSRNLTEAAGLRLIPESIEVVRTPVNTKRNGTPLRFDDQKRVGVSDHFPLYARLKIIAKAMENKPSTKTTKPTKK